MSTHEARFDAVVHQRLLGFARRPKRRLGSGLLAAVLLVAPLGFVMGRFLPLGIVSAGRGFEDLVPWAWGLNGAASVLGSVLAMALALNLGFQLTFTFGLLFYGAALWAARSFDTDPGESVIP